MEKIGAKVITKEQLKLELSDKLSEILHIVGKPMYTTYITSNLTYSQNEYNWNERWPWTNIVDYILLRIQELYQMVWT